MTLDLVSALLGGIFALAGTVLGALLTYVLNVRLERRRQIHELGREARELVLQEYRDLSTREPVQYAPVAAQLVRDGAVLLPPRVSSPRLREIRPEDPMSFACVPYGTLITMADGELRPIENIVSGDTISTYDAARHVRSTERVIELRTGETAVLIEINRAYQITPGQQVFADGEYRSAERLSLGQQLIDDQARAVAIESLAIFEAALPCTSIVLESGHSFFARPAADKPSIVIREGQTGKSGPEHMVFRDGRFVIESR